MKRLKAACTGIAAAGCAFAALAFAATLAANAATVTYRQGNVPEPELAIDPANPDAATMIPYSSPALAFAGATLDDIAGCTFVGWRKFGVSAMGDGTSTYEAAQHVTSVDTDNDGKIDKIAMQFTVRDGTWTKGGVVQLTNRDGGVYVHWTHRVWYSASANTKIFTVDETTGEVTVSADNVRNYVNHPNEMNCYNIWGFHAVPGFLPAVGGNGGVVETALPINYSSPGSTTPLLDSKHLAFPGVTLDDVAGCTFLSYHTGAWWAGSYAVSSHVTPVDTDNDGSLDKIVYQYYTFDGSWSKATVYSLENDDGGVYVKFLKKCAKSGNTQSAVAFTVAADGTVGYTSAYDLSDGNEYCVGGLVAMRPADATPVTALPIDAAAPGSATALDSKHLAFPGATLDNVKDCAFLSVRTGPWWANNAILTARYPTAVDTDGNGTVDKIVLQFSETDGSWAKGSVLELTNGDDGMGVYVQFLKRIYKSGGDGTVRGFEVAADGTVSYVYYDTNAGTEYGVSGLVAVPQTAQTAKPVLLWTKKKGGALTLNDLAGAKFTAQFGGGLVNSGAAANIVGSTAVNGLNTREEVDANGDITSITTEFQNADRKTVVVKFTNGAEGVYAQALGAVDVATFGYVASDANGNLYGSAYVPVADSNSAFGYGVCSLSATANAAKVYRQGPTRTFAVVDDASPASNTQFPTSETVGFSGVTLEDLAGCTLLSYMQSGSIPGRYLLGEHMTLYPSSGAAEKLAVQFTADDGGWKKSAFVQFAYNANGAVTIQKVRNTWTTSGNAATKYFNDNFFTVGPTDSSSYNCSDQNNSQYHLWGLRVLPGFVQTTATRLFNGITLNDIEGAAFTAHMGGPLIGASTARVEGYNVHVVKSGDDVTRMIVEFQCMDGGWNKCVVVELTNETDGVYGKAIRAAWNSGLALGAQIVNYNGDEIAGYNGDNDDSVAVNALSGRYGVYDVQAEVDVPTEWVLDQNRSWSEFTGGEPIDDAAATIRIKVTGDNPVLTIDENVTIGQIVFVNETGAAASTNAVVISGAVASIGAVRLGEGANVSLPPALASAAAALGNGSKLTYTGPATVSQTISGAGGVEVASGSVTFMAANSFTGGFVVKSGATAVAGFAPGQGATDGPFGAIDGAVTVEAGGMVDINGKNGLSYRYTLAGIGIGDKGPIVNLGGALDIGSTDWNRAWTTGHAREFSLAGDITLGSQGNDFGIVSKSAWEIAQDECWLGLGNLGNSTGYTLTKTGTCTLWLWASRLSASGYGTLSIQQGTVDIRKGRYVGASSAIAIGASGTLRLGSQVEVATIANDGLIQIVPWYYAHNYSGETLTGAYSGSGKVEVLSGGRLNVGTGLSVADFENKGTVEGVGALTVTGTLTPGAAIPNLTLASGATIELLATNAAPQVVTGAFSASGIVTVGVSAVEKDDLVACAKAGDITLLTAPSIPSGVTWAVSDPSKLRARVKRDGEGDHVVVSYATGFAILIR